MTPEHKEKLRLARELAKQERAAGLRPPLKNSKTAKAAKKVPAFEDEDTSWMDDAQAALSTAVHTAEAPSMSVHTSFVETPEFRAAVAAAVALALETKTQEIADRLAAQRQPGVYGDAPPANEVGFARVLAAQLAELIDQDRRRSGQAARLSGEEIEVRREARERMEQLLVDAFAGQKDPQYNVMAPLYLEEQTVDPTWQNPATKILMRRQIVWYGIPNEKMHPANAAAEEIHAAFLRSIGGVTAPVNRPDLGRPKLRVVGSSDVETTPAVGKPKNIGMLKLLGDTVAGQITETNVLGTIAAPARQLA